MLTCNNNWIHEFKRRIIDMYCPHIFKSSILIKSSLLINYFCSCFSLILLGSYADVSLPKKSSRSGWTLPGNCVATLLCLFITYRWLSASVWALCWLREVRGQLITPFSCEPDMSYHSCLPFVILLNDLFGVRHFYWVQRKVNTEWDCKSENLIEH